VRERLPLFPVPFQMAKKKTSREPIPLAGYIPAGFNPSDNIKTILQIPPYPDKGVRFDQYSKDQKGSDYILFRNSTRFYSIALTNQISPTLYTLTRSNKATTVFYCAGIYIQYVGTGNDINDYIDLYDGSAINPRFRFFVWSQTGSLAHNVFIDLSNCPREFNSDIVISIANGLSNQEFIHIEMFGWDQTL
jgi:hypothetical protein